MSDDDPGSQHNNFFSGLFAKKTKEKSAAQQIRELVVQGTQSGEFQENEAKLIENVLDFSSTQVHEIMTHTAEIDYFDGNMTVEKAFQRSAGDGYSRHPVINGDIDTIIGIMHLKDLAGAYLKPELRQTPLSDLGDDLLIPPFFIPETRNINKLFRDMQRKKTHMAVVIDEYGQTAGIVTMEDILEELVGDIEDEHDEDDKDIVQMRDGSYVISGQAELSDVSEKLGVSFDVPEDITTMNGFMTDRMGRIPEEGDKFSIVCDGWTFVILSVKNRLVRRVKAEKVNQKPISD